MGKMYSSIWESDYTSESKKASGGKLKEVFRGKDEFDRHLGKVESVVVHYLPPHAAFDTTIRSKRIFYAWENGFDVILNSEAFQLYEDHKLSVSEIYHPLTIGNSNSQKPALLVEVSSSPFSKASYKTVGESEVKHMPLISNPNESREFLDGKLEQITAHNLDLYSLEGNHYHNDGKKELFLVAKGLVHTFERKIEKSSENPETEYIIGRIQSRDAEKAVLYDTYLQGQSFNFDEDGFSHAIAAGKKPARLIELANIVFDPFLSKSAVKQDIIVPKSVNKRKILLEKLGQSL